MSSAEARLAPDSTKVVPRMMVSMVRIRLSLLVDIDTTPELRASYSRMDPHERATSVWYRVAGLLRRKELAIEIFEAEIRSAQQEVWREAAKLVLTGDPVEIARKLHERAEQTIRPQ